MDLHLAPCPYSNSYFSRSLDRTNKGRSISGQTPASTDLPGINHHHHNTLRAKRNRSRYQTPKTVQHEDVAMRRGGVWPRQHRRRRKHLAQRLYRYPFVHPYAMGNNTETLFELLPHPNALATGTASNPVRRRQRTRPSDPRPQPVQPSTLGAEVPHQRREGWPGRSHEARQGGWPRARGCSGSWQTR